MAPSIPHNTDAKPQDAKGSAKDEHGAPAQHQLHPQGMVRVTVSEVHQQDQNTLEVGPPQLLLKEHFAPALSKESIHSCLSCPSCLSSLASDQSIGLEEKGIYPSGAAPKYKRYHQQLLLHLPRYFTSLQWQYKLLSILIMIMVPAIILGAALSLTRGVAAKTPGPIADVGYSSFQGNALNGVNEWLGVRYAAPPTKENRFKAPQPPKKENKLQQATKWASHCLPTPSTGKTDGTDEDCLFLNIWAPADKSKTHPVYVFLQGGGLNNNASPKMNGTNLVETGDHDIVVVTLNYRVGVFGFLASKEVKKDGHLNVGNLDQRFALQWVQKNIEKFGGDNKRVTLGGASAGAASVNLHLTAYGGRDDGLFQAAVGHSNSFGYQLTIDESQYQYDALVSRAKCDQGDKKKDTLKCLRNLPVDQLIKINMQGPHPGQKQAPLFMYSNTIDGEFTPTNTYKAFAEDKFIKVPTIFGSDSNEGTIFTPGDIKNYEDMNNFLKANYPKLTAEHLATIDHHYPKMSAFPGKGDYWRTAATAYGEMRYNCPGYTLPKRYAERGSKNTWHYHYDVVKPENDKNGNGVTHCADVDPIWGTASGPDKDQTPIISKYYASFIRMHDPNALKLKEAPEWTRFEATDGKQQGMHFVNDPKQNRMENTVKYAADQCDWFAKIGIDIGM